MTEIALVILTLSILFYLMGPRVKANTELREIELPDDLDEYLKKKESSFDDLVPGAEKTIIWANKPGQRTALSIIYLHGFSACRQETAPLSDIIAKNLGANLFYTRFTGHGRSKEAMAECSINSWANDLNEAMAIGSRIGERVIVIGLSTGATAATWLSMQPMGEQASAFILLSPNFGLADRRSRILTWPWAKHIAFQVLGKEYGWEPHNALHRKYWTHRFPTVALLPMMKLVRMALQQKLELLKKPTLIMYCPEDKVVSVKAIEKTIERFGAERKEILTYSGTTAPQDHVLAGDILSPGSTDEVADLIVDFIRTWLDDERITTTSSTAKVYQN